MSFECLLQPKLLYDSTISLTLEPRSSAMASMKGKETSNEQPVCMK